MSRRRWEEEEEEEWPEEEEEEEEKEEKEEIDVEDLTQLPGVDKSLERKLKELGYETLWEIAEAEADELAKDAGVTAKDAEKMIAAANKILGIEEE